MILEKIKQHAWKVLLFLTGVLIFMIWIVFNKQRSLEQESANLYYPKQDSTELKNIENDLASQTAVISGEQVNSKSPQELIAADRQQKLDNLNSNPIVVTKQETVPVTTIVPGATRKVVVPSGSAVATSKATTSSPAKAAPAPAPKPAKKTKTS